MIAAMIAASISSTSRTGMIAAMTAMIDVHCCGLYDVVQHCQNCQRRQLNQHDNGAPHDSDGTIAVMVAKGANGA